MPRIRVQKIASVVHRLGFKKEIETFVAAYRKGLAENAARPVPQLDGSDEVTAVGLGGHVGIEVGGSGWGEFGTCRRANWSKSWRAWLTASSVGKAAATSGASRTTCKRALYRW